MGRQTISLRPGLMTELARTVEVTMRGELEFVNKRALWPGRTPSTRSRREPRRHQQRRRAQQPAADSRLPALELLEQRASLRRE
ncbi:hypothetical protein [Jiangella rhizosphaerae]|uniref:hypothetical protein n=1 Tax=Jiangella rhizosphaerae TaxID=2293569 RepID=UPI0011C4523D|nr:hypothetical protein [Jiangella rhizosphaerae]